MDYKSKPLSGPGQSGQRCLFLVKSELEHYVVNRRPDCGRAVQLRPETDSSVCFASPFLREKCRCCQSPMLTPKARK